MTAGTSHTAHADAPVALSVASWSSEEGVANMQPIGAAADGTGSEWKDVGYAMEGGEEDWR